MTCDQGEHRGVTRIRWNEVRGVQKRLQRRPLLRVPAAVCGASPGVLPADESVAVAVIAEHAFFGANVTCTPRAYNVTLVTNSAGRLEHYPRRSLVLQAPPPRQMRRRARHSWRTCPGRRGRCQQHGVAGPGVVARQLHRTHHGIMVVAGHLQYREIRCVSRNASAICCRSTPK